MKKEYPEKYWHCYANMTDSKKRGDYSIINDLTFPELKKNILIPWHNNKPFSVGRIIVRSTKDVKEIRISYTEQPQEVHAKNFNQRMRANGIMDIRTDREKLPLDEGEDYTYELLFDSFKEVSEENQLDLVLRLCHRLKKSAHLLGHRTRVGKESYKIDDEYDVQDLLQAILRGYLKYSVTEDPIGKVAGTKSARADISIEELGTIIEVKYVRSPSDQKKLLMQYSEDMLLYAKWEHLQTFIYYIYNSDILSDGEALEKLSGHQSISGKDFKSIVVLG